MRWRIVVLAALAVLTLAYQGMALYMRYLSPDLASKPTFKTELKDGACVVTAVDADAKPRGADPAAGGGLRVGDRIVAIHDDKGRGGEVTGEFGYGALLRPIGPNDSWGVVVERDGPAGRVERLPIRVPPAIPIRWTPAEWLANLGVDLYLPMLALGAGLLIGFMKYRDNQAYLAALVFLGFSSAFRQEVGQLPVGWRETALFVKTTAFAFAPWLILQFFLRFPKRSVLDRKARWLVPASFALASVFWALMLAYQFTAGYSFAASRRLVAALASVGLDPDLLLRAFGIFTGALIVVSLLSLALNTMRADSRDDRRRMVLILTGAVTGLVPFLIAYEIAPNLEIPWPWLKVLLILLTGAFPISFVYAVVRHRMFGIRLIVRRGLQYLLVSRGFLLAEGTAFFLALYLAAGPVVRKVLPAAGPVLASAGFAALTLGLMAGTRRLNRSVLPAIDRRFFRDAWDSRRILTELSRAVRELASRPDRLLDKVAAEIGAALHPAELAIFLADRPWPHLAPPGPDAIRWSSPVPGATAESYLLRAGIRPSPGGEGPAGAASRAGRALYSRQPLSRVLASSARGVPETLDVFPVSAARPLADYRAPGVSGDEALFERLDARLVVPIGIVGRALGFLVLGEKLSEEPYSSQDKELLLAVAEHTATALDYSLLIDQVAEQEKVKRDLQIAHEVQERLFPQELPPMGALRYAGACRTAQEVGGDYYDFLELGPGRLGIVVADIAGKGLSAALLMASLQALVRSHAPTYADDLAGLVGEVNRHLCHSTDDSRFASLFVAIWDDRTRTLRFVNAGHNAPILLRSRAGDGPEVRRLAPGGMVIGLFADRTYREETVSLEAGDLLVVFSDGVVEASNERGEQLGDAALLEMVRRDAGLPEAEIVSRVLEESARFLGGAPPQDDTTLIVARVV